MIPITGRDVERRHIQDLVERVQGGGPAVLVLSGPAGAGKSRLLRDWSDERVRRLDVVGYEPESGIAFAAVGSVLSNLLGESALRAVMTSDRGSAPAPLHVFEAAFAALASAGPTVLVLDDLQWLDASSAALTHYLVRGALASELPFGLLAATRPGPEAAPHIEALERLFGDRTGLLVHDLGPLSEAESIAVVRAAAPGTTDAAAARLWQRVGGSPYWLLALARATGDDPGSVLRERLARLSVDAATALGLLAVAGRPTERSMARRLLRWADERLDGAVRDLIRTGLVNEGVDGLRAAHDLVREAIVAELPEQVRREHHARLARVLETRAGGDAPQRTGDELRQLATALGHRLAAGLPAVDLALRVASAPDRRLLGSAGLDELRRAIEAADPAEPQLAQLRLAVARLASEIATSQWAFEQWRALAVDGPPESRQEARLAAAHEAFRLSRPDDLRDLLAGVEQTGHPLTVIEVGALEASSMLWLEARFADGRARAADLLGQARRLMSQVPEGAVGKEERRTRQVTIAALKVAFEASMQAEEWQTLPDLAAELVDASTGLDGRARIEALLYSGMALRYHGHREAAAERYRAALDIARRDLLPDKVVEAASFLAATLQALGRLSVAETVAREAVEVADRVGDYSKLRTRPRTLLSEIRLLLGPWPEAFAAMDTDAADLDPHYRLTLRQVEASVVSQIQGRTGAARVARLVAASRADADLAGCPRCLREAQLVNAGSLARVGRVEEARDLLEAARATKGTPEPYVADMGTWAEALIASQPASRSERLEEVVERCRGTGRRIDAIWATLDLGRSLIESDPARSAAVLREAGIEAVSLGATTQAQVADRLLRGLGQRTWRRGTAGAGLFELTERERQVADLVAGGASNAEIADSLFVSVKTVERHVSNLFAKFDVRNRTELARLWPRLVDDGAASMRAAQD